MAMASHSLSSLSFSTLLPSKTHFNFQPKSTFFLSLKNKPTINKLAVHAMGTSASSPTPDNLQGLFFIFFCLFISLKCFNYSCAPFFFKYS